jgi:DNA-binding response OmpR family regulator
MDAAILLLLVEDEDMVRDILEASLTDGGFALELASRGEGAIRVIEERGKTLRGLITDINLGPGPNGWEVAHRGREVIPDIPVVYMSGAAGHEWTARGVPNSIFIAKPFAPAQVLAAISSLLIAKDSHSATT